MYLCASYCRTITAVASRDDGEDGPLRVVGGSEDWGAVSGGDNLAEDDLLIHQLVSSVVFAYMYLCVVSTNNAALHVTDCRGVKPWF